MSSLGWRGWCAARGAGSSAILPTIVTSFITNPGAGETTDRSGISRSLDPGTVAVPRLEAAYYRGCATRQLRAPASPEPLPVFAPRHPRSDTERPHGPRGGADDRPRRCLRTPTGPSASCRLAGVLAFHVVGSGPPLGCRMSRPEAVLGRPRALGTASGSELQGLRTSGTR